MAEIKTIYNNTFAPPVNDHTHSNKSILDNITSNKMFIHEITDVNTPIRVDSINIVWHSAAANMPNPNTSYLLLAFDEYDVVPEGNSVWKLFAIELTSGNKYKCTSGIDSSNNTFLKGRINWSQF